LEDRCETFPGRFSDFLLRRATGSIGAVRFFRRWAWFDVRVGLGHAWPALAADYRTVAR
jgi:hypothetical protein